MLLVDACITEWRCQRQEVVETFLRVLLVDACITEWRRRHVQLYAQLHKCYSLMPVSLNGGACRFQLPLWGVCVLLVDACITEWRQHKHITLGIHRSRATR